MKILLVNSVCGVGSTGKICVDLAKIAQEKGHNVVIAYGRNDAKNWDNTYKITNSFDNKLHFLKSKLFDKHGLGSIIATKKFVKFIKKYNPDVIHLHNIHGYYLNYKILFNFLKTYKGKIVWTLHDMWAFTGGCACPITCNKWQTYCDKCPQLCEYPKTIIDRRSKNYNLKKSLFVGLNNLTIVTPSKWLEEEVKKSFLNGYPIKVINNGIDLSIFKPQKTDFRSKYNLEDKKLILGVSNIWEKRKGLDDFIKLSKLIDENSKIVLVGLSKEQINALPNNIIGIERTKDQNELASLYTTADIFVNFTYSDNFPTVNLESLACGTPVLTYKTGGSPESLSKETGFVVEQGDVEKAFNIIKNFRKTDQIKQKCVDRAVALYDKNKKFLEYIKMYDKK